MAAIILKPGREKPILRRHPWIFSGAVAHLQDEPENGGTVDVLSADKTTFLARAAYSHHSNIRARVWTWDENQAVGAEFFRQRLRDAIAFRQSWIEPSQTNAMRLVYAESDGLPGLIVDRYGDVLIMQCLTSGAAYWRETFADILLDLTGVDTIYERSDVDVRNLEGLPHETGVLRGVEPPETIQIVENGLLFGVDVRRGHKTGFYLDQRANRQRVRAFSQGRRVLDCFSYTGGFTISALTGGAESVVSVDSSSDALEGVQANLRLNDLPEDQVELLEGDVFQELRKFRDRNRQFDMIILDPPKFAPTKKQIERASRGYKDINLLAFKLLTVGGILVTFSCSGGVSADLFQKIVAGAALDAGADVQIIEHLSQGADHPIALNFPEGAYLKGLVCRKK